MEYTEAHEAAKLAQTIIKNYHTHLQTTRIDFLFVDKPIKIKGKTVAGRARKISGLTAYLATRPNEEPQDFFVIEISKLAWDRYKPKQKKALVDHELKHCWIDENGKLTTVGHDCEEFYEIIDRYGLWDESLQGMGRVMQSGLPFDELDEPSTVSLQDATNARPS